MCFPPDNDKSNEDWQKEEELLQQIHKLVETRDFMVDDVEFERLRFGVCVCLHVLITAPQESFGVCHYMLRINKNKKRNPEIKR